MEIQTKRKLKDAGAVERFLRRHQAALNKTIEDHKALYATQPSDRVLGQIRYFEAAAKYVRWLLAVNRQGASRGTNS